jgi:hypothetical protein
VVNLPPDAPEDYLTLDGEIDPTKPPATYAKSIGRFGNDPEASVGIRFPHGIILFSILHLDSLSPHSGVRFSPGPSVVASTPPL